MSDRSYNVTATWDAEASVWVATSDDVPGLVAEAATPEELQEKLRALVPELLDLNGHLTPQGTTGGGGPVSVNTHFAPFDQELEIA